MRHVHGHAVAGDLAEPPRLADQLQRTAALGEPREYVDSSFRAEPTGTAGAADLGGRACSTWVHCHHADPGLSATRCELRTTVELPALDAAGAVLVRSRLRSHFPWVEATSSQSGLAAIRADAWLEIAIGADAAVTTTSTSFYDHVSTGRQLYFPNQKHWTTELRVAVDVPPGAGGVLLVTEAIEILASADEGSNAYVSGRFAWEPLRVHTSTDGRWDQVTLPAR